MDDFSDLFKPAQWEGFLKLQFVVGDVPDEDLISNINIVPFVGQWVVIIKTTDGRYEIPGGTREPDEPYLDTIHRELCEEAGAQLKTGAKYTPVGYWHCESLIDKPYRPHLPHPVSFRMAGYADVEIFSDPLNPPDGEQIAAVEVVPLDRAVERFLMMNRPDIADLYRLCAENRRKSK